MVTKGFFAVLTALAFLLAPLAALADDTVVKKGSVERTGTAPAATIAQASDESDDDGIATGAIFLGGAGAVGGGIAAGLLFGGGDDDDNGGSTSTSTSTSP